MAKQHIGIGSAANDGTGDTLRGAGQKVNEVFDEIYSTLGNGADLTVSVNTVADRMQVANTIALVDDRLQVANAAAIYATKAYAASNTHTYLIFHKTADAITANNTQNIAIADRMQVANTVAMGISSIAWSASNNTITLTRPDASELDIVVTGFAEAGSDYVANNWLNATYATNTTVFSTFAQNTATIALINDRLQPANATLDFVVSTGNTTTQAISLGGLALDSLESNNGLVYDKSGSIASSAKLFVDETNGRLGLNTTPSVSLDIVTEAADGTQVKMSQHNDNADASNFDFYKSRGTKASPVAVVNEDFLSNLNTFAYSQTGSAYVQSGALRWKAHERDGNSTLEIQTRVSGTLANRVAVVSNGHVEISGAYTLPKVDGANNAVLTTNGNGHAHFREVISSTSQFDVTANSNFGFLVSPYGYNTGNNPSLYVLNGTTVAFNLNVPGHAFTIRDSGGNEYGNTLIHIATDGTKSVGAAAQGKSSGILYWQIPVTIKGALVNEFRYTCNNFSAMSGTIYVKDITSL